MADMHVQLYMYIVSTLHESRSCMYAHCFIISIAIHLAARIKKYRNMFSLISHPVVQHPTKYQNNAYIHSFPRDGKGCARAHVQMYPNR